MRLPSSLLANDRVMTERSLTGHDGPKQDRGDRALPFIATERVLRAVVLIAVGLVLLTHLHTDWQRTLTDFAERAGLNPNRNGIARLLNRAGALQSHQLARDGAIAVGYGLLEGLEGYGLFRRRSWAEYLTVFSTALLFIPEIDELIRQPTAFKVAALVLNLVIVIYLIFRLGRKHRAAASSRGNDRRQRRLPRPPASWSARRSTSAAAPSRSS